MVSVIVPTYNRGRAIGPTLESLLAQDTAMPLEVIVVDNRSTDDTREAVLDVAARSEGRVRYVFEAEQGSSAARNAGIAAAGGDIIAFVDDDVIARPGWLQAIIATFLAHPDAWCVGGKVELQLPERLPPWFDPSPGVMTTLLSLQDLGDTTFRFDQFRGLISANLAVTKAALERVGVFNTGLGRFGQQLLCGEDIELCRRIYRAGGGVYYCGQASVLHLVPDRRITLRFFRERAYWEGRTDALVRARPPGIALVRWLWNDGFLMAKDWGKALIHAALGDPVRALQCELAARKQLGDLTQMLQAGAGMYAPAASATTQQLRAQFRVEVIDSLQKMEALAKPWDDLAAQSGVSVFQTYPWHAAWCRAFPAGRRLRVITLWDGAELVGIAPFVLETISLAWIPLLRILRYAGGQESDYLDLIVRPGLEREVAAALADHVASSMSGWDVLELEEVPAASRAVGLLATAMLGRGCKLTRMPHHKCLVIGLPSSLEDYLQQLSSRTRKNLGYESRKLFGGGGEVEVVSEEDALRAALHEFFALHDRRWKDKGLQGAVADPKVRAFHAEVACEFLNRGWLNLSFLRLNGHRLAADYGFVYGGRAYSYLTGLDTKSPWARFSPGTVLALKNIERAIVSGIAEYDFLRGAESYKTRLGAKGRLNWRYAIVRPRPSSILRGGLWRMGTRVSHLARLGRNRIRSIHRRVRQAPTST